jgi:DNA repair exonuclease SbcCD nuclease subunit
MKLRIFSDVHLEHNDWQNFETRDEDAILIAGDLSSNSAVAQLRLERFLKRTQLKPVYCVVGNHDFYFAEYHERWEILREMEKNFPNVHWLENQVAQIGNIRLLGTSLATDFGGDEKAALLAGRGINDFHFTTVMENGERGRWRPRHLIDIHAKAKEFLERELRVDHGGPTVVMTHWVPSFKLTDSRYSGDPMNPYFSCSMDHLFSPKVNLWVHGHSHGCLDKVVGGTRHIRNTRGYPTEKIKWDPYLTVDL